MLGLNKTIGVSCYNQPALAQKAQADGADYIAFGAVLPSKPNPVHKGIVKLVCVSAAINHIPVVGVGGITLVNAKQVKRQEQMQLH